MITRQGKHKSTGREVRESRESVMRTMAEIPLDTLETIARMFPELADVAREEIQKRKDA